ncbi:uncharacterized protein N7498_005962 [Penicillium cinerascens]|uniref:Methyltransferase type 11 domain-containing protein n=1 Tax=Penicillium cinerascens TaxID=70096 RepID=A0A9W9T0M6_9EURO|nr:uncharacterized protein N7498_005962 [Penicillium cinerascens]KAJ5205083.1 hypothetical protein N7498_005962 [Penicillium cinerascens]
MSFIYATDDPPENHIARLLLTNRPAPHKPSYGMDSPLGLVASNFLAPLYLYTSLKGKFNAWDKLLAKVPPEIFMYPSLDIGCGRGLVLMKIAERKKDVAFSMTRTPDPVYGIDLFIRGDQSGNAPEATYDNAASLNLTDYLTLHTANFIYLPFKDETMSLATASLSIHNADKASRKIALIEAARVLKPDGYLIILDLAGYIGQYKSVLKSMGWSIGLYIHG